MEQQGRWVRYRDVIRIFSDECQKNNYTVLITEANDSPFYKLCDIKYEISIKNMKITKAELCLYKISNNENGWKSYKNINTEKLDEKVLIKLVKK